MLGRAPEQTVAQFRASVKRAVLRVASPAEEEQAHADAVAERRVIVTPVDRGMAELWACCPPLTPPRSKPLWTPAPTKRSTERR